MSRFPACQAKPIIELKQLIFKPSCWTLQLCTDMANTPPDLTAARRTRVYRVMKAINIIPVRRYLIFIVHMLLFDAWSRYTLVWLTSVAVGTQAVGTQQPVEHANLNAHVHIMTRVGCRSKNNTAPLRNQLKFRSPRASPRQQIKRPQEVPISIMCRARIRAWPWN